MFLTVYDIPIQISIQISSHENESKLHSQGRVVIRSSMMKPELISGTKFEKEFQRLKTALISSIVSKLILFYEHQLMGKP